MFQRNLSLKFQMTMEQNSLPSWKPFSANTLMNLAFALKTKVRQSVTLGNDQNVLQNAAGSMKNSKKNTNINSIKHMEQILQSKFKQRCADLFEHHSKALIVALAQCGSTTDPRAACGPRKHSREIFESEIC